MRVAASFSDAAQLELPLWLGLIRTHTPRLDLGNIIILALH